MVFETRFTKYYNKNNCNNKDMEETIRDTFNKLENELNNIGHKLNTKPFDNVFCCSTYAEAEYIIANSSPVAVAKLSGHYSRNNNEAEIILCIKHFSGRTHKFPEIENIVEAYHMGPGVTGESWSGIANNPHAKD